MLESEFGSLYFQKPEESLNFTAGVVLFLFKCSLRQMCAASCGLFFLHVLPSMWRKQHVSASWSEILDCAKREGWKKLRHLGHVSFTTV